ncbi:A. fulgidus predicted coding region AF1183 [Halorubrum sp. DM2]|uniref:OapC/ArvC family zinc-ribbon domain-containing protein n=1 Tax=Halorubrum sp. DM2 TaxID=2527867 RepID=UPI0024B7A4A8|nr:Zn-ribbon containing protein [Halorubrum sp. DM2]VTT86804.1 A. fulgidus predicted coding region AF1183 [Halorubrum sp. DM2]
MPHQCTTCGRTFPDGSKEMLSGCPDCGGNKFQFKPAGATEDPTAGDDAGSAGATADPSPPAPEDGAASTPDEHAADQTPSEGHTDPASGESADATRPDDAASDDPSPETDGTEQIADRSDEDTAQASARSEVVSPDELDRASREVEGAETPPADEEPQSGIDALRDELNDQFESIRIVSPGQYELNLMELYDRQEYIISLQEDGRYVIEMPDAWGIQDE